MDTTKIEDRLKLYELALVDYEASLGKDERYKFKNNTEGGFCIYFYHCHGLAFTSTAVPELYRQRPMTGSIYWFPTGDIQPRIDCLKRAIELTKSKIWEQS